MKRPNRAKPLSITLHRLAQCLFMSLFMSLLLGQAWAGPLIVAHRGGTGDAPENTLPAFAEALDHHADALWMTVQITRDGVPVLYRPADLASLTDGHGRLDQIDFAELRKLNAGFSFGRKDAAGQLAHPYRDAPIPIPTLREALDAVPPSVPIMLDMKQAPAAPLVEAVAKVLDETRSWQRVRLYSTDVAATALMRAMPRAQVFESRDATRMRLVQLAMNGACDSPPAPGTWAGIEFHRQLEVIERYTLGAGVSKVDAHWWTPAAVQCFKSRGDVHLVVFGVETPADYAAAAALGVDAVMTDSPERLAATLRTTAAK
ncbi:glycerophosphodiester phosphodiesterase family protein [Trinickia caryophylli]|uniref:Glycerophosphoryl diester phosphodiesterase n=1 Tax=Trinickia caryophylli TaxID=28094 RepID=A0A1X7GPJ0_TRICW|nr:glycerophosphodiester phosphodiesterase family protein [Trinickia caryophylli]PMS10490.1 glycerophosphodiester phosphodiesterase [Trinickia caryophylli]TRX19117.1 glycerophosphodiester phosphodiesterase [Trinickia caryophylli]WQE13586.1 glycerophosphodiester phosphodiesterase family protein [Trinickia caryophylli]SMF72596.1 glycerophosphoryl diester phosphodiesterase [Trinickia caryophylli]GLU35100.1 hydrolase [Trinickia caryophylli]